jgi:Tn3 transposase DDE domain
LREEELIFAGFSLSIFMSIREELENVVPAKLAVEPELRRRIRRGLLKVEQLHALARDVFYGRRGRINARELWEQMNTCSCLTLILACIVYWQAREISRVLSQCDPVGNGIDLSLLEHVSPIEWDNVVLYGQYILDRKLVRRRRRAMRASA